MKFQVTRSTQDLLVELEMAKSRKARGKRLATRKSKASPKQEDTTTTTCQVPSATKAHRASSYRMPLSILAHPVEDFPAPNQLQLAALQYRQDPPCPEHAAKKSSTSLVHETATTTTQIPSTPDAAGSPIYRLPLSSINHPVEDFENLAPLVRNSSQHPQETPAFDYTAKFLDSVRNTADTVHALIELKKIVSLPSNISTESDPGEFLEAGVEVFRNAVDAASYQFASGQDPIPESHYDAVTTTLAGSSHGHKGFAAWRDAEEQETVDAEMLDAWTLGPPVVVTDNSSLAPELQTEQLKTTTTHSAAQEQKPDSALEQAKGHSSAGDTRKTINIQTQDGKLDDANHGISSDPETRLEAIGIHSFPVTPVFPVIDVDHSSPTSSRSSVHDTPEKHEKIDVDQDGKYMGQKYYNRHRKEWKASHSVTFQPGSAIERLGPSIMFKFFSGMLE
ncbi:uncharacterized protein N0V89_000903 [Didymosphaeria variabile]|uniref:Uncharacterized protein n=1 Tax=Didymosphaeria variabile TaxID=1932322 RepID=A0A9W8XW71_9PLEO|nr:uncharacterized protein N0V89_000903 [Didymosphaeria variabile]KAJ4360341.1 hypothetical protein N0V89_000903 [Didymosphaeria variabile]